MASKTRIDMGHGFMQSIIRNQVDRDNYDKEVKASQNQQKSVSRERRPPQPIYTPPVMRSPGDGQQDDCADVSRSERLFIFEYEDEHGVVHRREVNKKDNALKLSEVLGRQHNLSPDLIKVLADFLQEEIVKRTTIRQ